MGRHGRLARKGIILATAAAGIFIGWQAGNCIWTGMVSMLRPEPVKIVKKIPVQVDEGDTVWSLCSRVATSEDDVNRMVFYTMKENHLDDGGTIQPGMVISVAVPERGTR